MFIIYLFVLMQILFFISDVLETSPLLGNRGTQINQNHDCTYN